MTEARHAAERLHQLLESTPMQDDDTPPIYITASIGICALTGSSQLDECLQKTDELLYRAKALGRNGTVCEP